MSVIRTAVAQPVSVVVGILLMLLAGALALRRIPIQLTPNVEDTIVAVTTRWEGASPREIEQDVVDKQEEKLQGLANLKQLTSISRQGSGLVRLEFAVGTGKADALRMVSDKLREVPDYPADVDEPVVEASDPQNRDYIAWILLQIDDPNQDVRELNDFAEDRIQPVLERVAGISEINVIGGRERELQVRFDPDRLAQRGVSPDQLIAAIRGTNRNLSAGALEQAKRDVRVRLVSQYESPEQVEQTVLRHTPSGPVRVGDVAEVLETFKEPSSFVRSKGRPVIAINAQKEVGVNVMEVMGRLRQAIAGLNAEGGVLEVEARRRGLSGGMHLSQVFDQTVYIDDALALVRNNIWIGGSLAVLVLLLFLRSVRSSAIIALSIPISVIGAVAAMVALGRTINVISLAGMAFAVGMVVDNAIVVLENIFRHLEMGKSRLQAALDGAREVAGAVLASTLTTVAVFLPILLVQEEAGQLFRDIALAIVAAVSLSLLVSLSVIPSAAARLLPRRHGRQGDEQGADVRGTAGDRPPRGMGQGMARGRRGLAGWLGDLIYRLCGRTSARVSLVLALTLASVLGSSWLLPPLDYLPQGNRNLVFGMLVPPSGYNLDQLGRLSARIEQTMAPFYEAAELPAGSAERAAAEATLPQVPTFDMQAMAPGPPVVPPPIENYFLVSFDGAMFHGAISADPRRVVDLMPLFSYATRPEVAPGVLSFAFQVPLFRLGGRTGSAVKLNFAGDDLGAVSGAARAAYSRLVERYGVFSVQPDPSNFNVPGPELVVRPDLVRLGEVGLTPAQLGLILQTLGDGSLAGEYRLAGESIDLKVISSRRAPDEDLDALGEAPVATPAGGVLPLSSLARLDRVNAPLQINRDNRQRSVTLQVTPPKGLPLQQVVDEIDGLVGELTAAGRIPPDVAASSTGSASKLAAVREAMLGGGGWVSTLTSSLVLALLVVYLLMCVLFQSFVSPLIIMLSVPLATLGGFAALFGVHLWSQADPYLPVQNLDILTMLGFVILIGVVVNNAILIVHQSLNFMRGDVELGTQPMPPREAIAEAVATRVRPILMSTATSVGGMLPLVLMPGSGSELYRGLGSVVVGGLVVSTVFTLLLVPLMLSLVTDVQQRLGRLPQGVGVDLGASADVGAGADEGAREGASAHAGESAGASAMLMLCLLLPLHGCASPPRRPLPDLAALAQAALAAQDRALDGQGLVPVATRAPESGVSAALGPRVEQLEAAAGPAATAAVHPELASDLFGRPQQLVPIDLPRAVAAAANFNLDIQLSRQAPLIDAEGVTISEAAFDATFFSQTDYQALDQLTTVPVLNGIVLGRPEQANITASLGAGASKRLSSGATVELSTFLERFRNRTEGIDFAPDPAFRSRLSLSIDQPLLRGAGSEVNLGAVALSENQRARSEQALRADLLTVMSLTEQAYWDLVEAWRRLAVQQHLTDEGQAVLDVLRRRGSFDAGPAEVADAMATLEQRKTDLLLGRRVVQAASDRLKGLMNAPELPVGGELLLQPAEDLPAEPVTFQLRDAVMTALRQRPEIRAALLTIEDRGVRERLAADEVLPKLDLSARLDVSGLGSRTSSSFTSTVQDRFKTYVLGLRFEIPIGNRASEAAERQARVRREGAIVAYQSAVQDLVLEVKAALRDVQTGYALIGAARSLRLAQTENLRTLELLEAQRQELTPEFLNLKFGRQQRLAEAQMRELSALADYNRALARYQRVLGAGSRLGPVVLGGTGDS